MDPIGDPFRVLGVTAEASLNEIRSAYRRLAKQYHPDTAGERALPRFLAIQAAYERLVDGEGRLRSAGGDPWKPAGRARASRDAWRARRSSARTSGAPGAARTGERPRTGQGAGPGAAPDGARPDGERPRRRTPRKATPGSTTYDEATETPFEPEWDGGAWYGPSMGTYWTINPREYADPRKHGPEYLARARRTTGTEPGPRAGGRGGAPGVTAPTPDTSAEAASGPAADAWAWSGTGPTTTDGDAADWAARSWTYDTRDPDGPAWSPGGEAGPRRPPDGMTWTHTTGVPGRWPPASLRADQVFVVIVLAIGLSLVISAVDFGPDPSSLTALAVVATVVVVLLWAVVTLLRRRRSDVRDP